MKRIGILTGGGDAPGLNAVIRAVAKTAIQEYDCQVLGIRNGFNGFLEEDGVVDLGLAEVRGILPRGGTILGAANRGNPFAREVLRDGQKVIEDVSHEVADSIHALHLDALIVVGGDGTLRIALDLQPYGVPVVGVPKTIDNDLAGTDFTFGFDTAMAVATEAIDRLHTTAEAHHRVMVLELMGRDAGFITLHAGLAGGADVILIPEIPFRYEAVFRKVSQRILSHSLFSIIAVAEGAHPAGGDPTYSAAGNAAVAPRLGGIGQKVGDYLNDQCGIETRVTVLGHLQRGGMPTPFDRCLATRMGAAAVRLAAEGGLGRVVVLQGNQIGSISLAEAASAPRQVDPRSDLISTARGLGISFGDN